MTDDRDHLSRPAQERGADDQGATLSRAVAHHQRGELGYAQALYREILQRIPSHFDALHLLGVLYAQTGRPQEAVAMIDGAILVAPTNPVAHCNRGIALQQLRQYDAALASYGRAVAIDPDYADAHCNLGNLYQELGRPEQALRCYETALHLRPGFGEALSNRGLVLACLKRLDEALASLNRAVEANPSNAAAHSNRGLVLMDLGRLQEALADQDRAIALGGNTAVFHSHRGAVLRYLGRFTAALECYERAIAIDPTFAEAYLNKAIILNDLNRPLDSKASSNKALELSPDLAPAVYSRALAALLVGDYPNGWRDFESRWKLDPRAATTVKRTFSQPLWLGEGEIAGRTILLHSEQGLGDTLQFCRYATLVAEAGARVILEVEQPLRALMVDLEGVTQVVCKGDPLPDFDIHCPVMSLPLAFKTTLQTIPSRVPYLKSKLEKRLHWADQLGPKTRLRVGLVWAGGFRPDHPESRSVNGRRNIPLHKLAALNRPDIEFHSLQKGQPAEAELVAATSESWAGQPPTNHAIGLVDFSDTAALIDQMDLVIAVDTSTAHLAAALGKPVWLLNRFDTCWRWMLDTDRSPWYPTVKIYRQRRSGDWEGVVDAVRTDLWRLAPTGI
jgi:tetratricopeptide (TPR) repeat protein